MAAAAVQPNLSEFALDSLDLVSVGVDTKNTNSSGKKSAKKAQETNSVAKKTQSSNKKKNSGGVANNTDNLREPSELEKQALDVALQADHTLQNNLEKCAEFVESIGEYLRAERKRIVQLQRQMASASTSENNGGGDDSTITMLATALREYQRRHRLIVGKLEAVRQRMRALHVTTEQFKNRLVCEAVRQSRCDPNLYAESPLLTHPFHMRITRVNDRRAKPEETTTGEVAVVPAKPVVESGNASSSTNTVEPSAVTTTPKKKKTAANAKKMERGDLASGARVANTAATNVAVAPPPKRSTPVDDDDVDAELVIETPKKRGKSAKN
jgi:hypothetical protein